MPTPLRSDEKHTSTGVRAAERRAMAGTDDPAVWRAFRCSVGPLDAIGSNRGAPVGGAAGDDGGGAP